MNPFDPPRSPVSLRWSRDLTAVERRRLIEAELSGEVVLVFYKDEIGTIVQVWEVEPCEACGQDGCVCFWGGEPRTYRRGCMGCE